MSNRLEQFLGPELLPLYRDGEKLLEAAPAGLSDYSFVVFTFAKIYESYLKKLFLAIGAINEYQYNNDRWRVGRALNPQLEKELRHSESVYDRIVDHCGGVELANRLWETWKRGRNQVFHFWPASLTNRGEPGRNRALLLSEAKEIIAEIEQTMEEALEECRIKY